MSLGAENFFLIVFVICLGLDPSSNQNVEDYQPNSEYSSQNYTNEESYLPQRHTLNYSLVNEAPGHHEIIAGLTVPGPITTFFPNLESFWNQFKTAHSKIYSRSLELKRKRQWIENLIRIHQHNEEARNGHHTYYLRANHLSDLNIYEYIRRMVRLSHSGRDFVAASPLSPVKRDAEIPEEWSWVDQGFITPAWDQKTCGSCYAFSIAASAEGQYFRKTKKIQNLSVQQIVDCSVLTGNLGCHGGSLRNTLRYCLHVGGLMAEGDYPYKNKQQICRFTPWQKKVNITSYVILPENDERALERAVATVGPVAVSINASPYTFQLYHKGIYDDPSCSSKRVNHAMVVVGYTKDAWILKNWWGDHWGMNGYMYLRKGKNRCAVAKYAGYPVVDDTPINEAIALW